MMSTLTPFKLETKIHDTIPDGIFLDLGLVSAYISALWHLARAEPLRFEALTIGASLSISTPHASPTILQQAFSV